MTTPARLRPGVTDVMALRVGYEKLHGETGWEPLVSWEEGVLRTIAWYAENRERWIGRVDWLPADRRGVTHSGRNSAEPQAPRRLACADDVPSRASRRSSRRRTFVLRQ